TCDGAFYRDKVVAVVGDGDHALEEAHFLTKFARQVHLVSPGKELKGDASLVEQLTSMDSVRVHTGVRVSEIRGEGSVAGVALRNGEAGENFLPADGVFLYLKGNKPITNYLGDKLRTGEGGCLLVDREMRTSVEGLYAIGDLLCTDLKQAVIAAAEGCIAAMSADKYINKRARVRKDYN
ncbi:MAG TPA: NAD(P)/FAD-dependent oxidoreductase, partial [bacterium]|nr:NAD(P)/FAD-dependent oxidoreductase [bacterium]